MCVSRFVSKSTKKKIIIAVDRHIKVIILGYDLENCFGHIVLPWQRTVIGFPRGFSSGDGGEIFTHAHTKTTLWLSVTFGRYCS